MYINPLRTFSLAGGTVTRCAEETRDIFILTSQTLAEAKYSERWGKVIN